LLPEGIAIGPDGEPTRDPTLARRGAGEARALYGAVVDADLEGIVAKCLADAYHPKHTQLHKVLNRA
jgi:ATP-dependent DNA ligase